MLVDSQLLYLDSSLVYARRRGRPRPLAPPPIPSPGFRAWRWRLANSPHSATRSMNPLKCNGFSHLPPSFAPLLVPNAGGSDQGRQRWHMPKRRRAGGHAPPHRSPPQENSESFMICRREIGTIYRHRGRQGGPGASPVTRACRRRSRRPVAASGPWPLAWRTSRPRAPLRSAQQRPRQRPAHAGGDRARQDRAQAERRRSPSAVPAPSRPGRRSGCPGCRNWRSRTAHRSGSAAHAG